MITAFKKFIAVIISKLKTIIKYNSPGLLCQEKNKLNQKGGDTFVRKNGDTFTIYVYLLKMGTLFP